jgi:sugar lactone lactonase YvrE
MKWMGAIAVASMVTSAIAAAADPLVVQRLAGSGAPGYADGARETASFSFPNGMVMGHDGALYVIDGANSVIRRVTADGTVTTFAGMPGATGSRDGASSEAQFNGLNSIAIDSAGNLFVTDNGNNAIRRITTAGVVSTFAGRAGQEGSTDGTGDAARFNHPHGIAADRSDNLYVADVLNQTIRKITPDGVVSTFAGRAGQRGNLDGSGTNARFDFPSGVAVDATGNVWITTNQTVRKITASGQVTTVAGSPGIAGSVDGEGSIARFRDVEGIAVTDAGDVYVVEMGNHVVRQIDAGNHVSTVAGSAGQTGLVDGIGSAVRFHTPAGITASGSRLYISEFDNAVIRVATPVGLMPTLDVRNLDGGATITNGWPVRVRASGFTFDCHAPESDDRGRWQLVIDGNVASSSCGASMILPALAAGQHQVTVRLVRSEGAPLLPAVERTIVVNVVTDPPFAYTSLVPAQARLHGAGGSFFRSTMWLVNRSNEDSVARLRFIPGAGFQDRSTANPVTVSVPKSQMVVFDDALSELFGVSGDTGGSITIEPGESTPRPLVTARTFNDTPNGTYGQYIREDSIATVGLERIIEGLSEDDTNRTNLGVINFGDDAMAATVTLVSATGEQLGNAIPTTVPPRSFIQLGRLTSLAGVPSTALFAARVTAERPFDAYASRLDNVTSDPVFITPLKAATQQWIDSVGSIPGANNTFFRSMLVLANRNTSEATVHLTYTERLATSPAAEMTLTIAANATQTFNDLAVQIFNRPGTAGWVSLSSDVPVTAWARTYNDRGTAGTYGQFIPAFSASDLAPSGGVVLSGVTESPAYRTNFGAVNVSSSPMTLHVKAVRDDGSLAGEKSYSLAATQSIFIGRILLDLGVTDGGSMYLLVTPSIPNAAYAWVSYVDNRSSDQTFVRPIPLSERD